MKRLAFIALAIAFGGGCGTTHHLVDLELNPKMNTVLIETDTIHDNLFFNSHERVFWQCAKRPRADGATALFCTRACREDSDLKCPATPIYGRRK